MTIEYADRPEEGVVNDLVRLLHQSEHRVNLLARAVWELAEVMGVEPSDIECPDGEPRSTQALMLAHEVLSYWRTEFSGSAALNEQPGSHSVNGDKNRSPDRPDREASQ